MKTKNILVSTFILIALNANSFATTQSNHMLKSIETQNVSLEILEKSKKNALPYSIAGRNKHNINGLKTINDFALSHAHESKKEALKITQKVGLFDITINAPKGRNQLLSGL